MNNKYIYRWEVHGQPIYFGQGSHNKTKKYRRSTDKHVFSNGHPSYAELKRIKSGDSFRVDILFDNLTEEEANDIEIFLIDKYGKKFDGSGILYNMADGGYINVLKNIQIANKRLDTLRSDQYRNKQRELVKKRWEDDAYRHKVLLKMAENGPNICKEQCKEITYNGITYSSKGELARKFNLTNKVLNYRLENNIALSDTKKANIAIEYEGVTYDRAKDLAKAYNRSPSLVSKNIKNGLDPIRGKNV